VRVLVLNAGSSSMKWSLLDGDTRATIDDGDAEWASPEIDQRAERVRAIVAQSAQSAQSAQTSRADAQRHTHHDRGFDVVGHRVVHGGMRFTGATVIDAAARAALDPLAELDPLHMRPALAGIDAVTAALPLVAQVAAFDTAFHARMPEAAAGYGLPFEWSERWGLRRYGFHGLSVEYSLGRARDILGKTPRRMIVCHLGSGCSITAVADGRSVDTTMGFTPLEGVMMATRSGSIDPGLLLYLQGRLGIAIAELQATLESRSGLLGVSGVSGDLRQVLAAADGGAARARLAYDRYVWSMRRAVGSMAAVLGGADAVVFTGGVGEHSERVRADVAAALGFVGLRLDDAANRGAAAEDRVISAGDSAIAALVVHAREDLTILDQILRLAQPAG
jgi:acetate kinase